MNELRIFESCRFRPLRTVTINGEPWFAWVDVTSALGYNGTFDEIETYIDERDQLVCQVDYAGRKMDLFVINEPGMYSLVLNSRLPDARKFARWVSSEVLRYF